MNKEKKQIAFKDFKSAVSVKEFKTIELILTEEYDRLKSVLDKANSLKKKAFKNTDNFSEKDLEFRNKLLKGLIRRGDQELFSHLDKEIKRSKEVTDFLNRFKVSGEELEYLDFSFLK